MKCLMSTWLLQWRAARTKSFYSKLKSLVRANQCTAMINCVLWQLRCTVLELWLFAYLKDNSLQFHTLKQDKCNTLYLHLVMLIIFISLLQMNYQLGYSKLINRSRRPPSSPNKAQKNKMPHARDILRAWKIKSNLIWFFSAENIK